jgi:hypothetical protein
MPNPLYRRRRRRSHRLRLRHRRRRHRHPTMENEFLAWVMEKRASSLCVITGMIQAHALRTLPNRTFSASNGWFDRFVNRKRLTIRRITTSDRELPRDTLNHTKKFLTECEPYMQMDFVRCHTMSWTVISMNFLNYFGFY